MTIKTVDTIASLRQEWEKGSSKAFEFWVDEYELLVIARFSDHYNFLRYFTPITASFPAMISQDIQDGTLEECLARLCEYVGRKE